MVAFGTFRVAEVTCCVVGGSCLINSKAAISRKCVIIEWNFLGVSVLGFP